MGTNLPARDLAQRRRVSLEGLRAGCGERDPHRVLHASGAVFAEARDIAVLLQPVQLLRQRRIRQVRLVFQRAEAHLVPGRLLLDGTAVVQRRTNLQPRQGVNNRVDSRGAHRFFSP